MSLLDNLAHLLQSHHQAQAQPQPPQQHTADQIYNAVGGMHFDPAVFGAPADNSARPPMAGPRQLPLLPAYNPSGRLPVGPGMGMQDQRQDMARMLQQPYGSPRLQQAYPGRAGAQGSWQVPSSFQMGDFGEMDDPRLQGGQFDPNQRY